MPSLYSLSVVVIFSEFTVSRLHITVVTAWLVTYTTIWETVCMSKCISTLGIGWVRLIGGVGGFLIGSDIVLEIGPEELKSGVLNTLSKVSASSSTLLSRSEASVNI